MPSRKRNGQWIARYGADEPRVCADCDEQKAADEFSAKIRNKDGTIRTRQSYCKECARERTRKRYDYHPRKTARKSKQETLEQKRDYYRRNMRDPEYRQRKRDQDREAARRRRERAKLDAAVALAMRESREKWLGKVYADPKRYTALIQDVRIRWRIRHETARSFTTAVGAYRPGRDDVPAEPFRDCLASLFPGWTPEAIEAETGLCAKTVRNLEGQHNVSLRVVDEALTLGLGRPDLVAALYPIEAS